MTPHQLGRTAYYSGVSRSACSLRDHTAKLRWLMAWDQAASDPKPDFTAPLPKLSFADWAVIARPQMESVSC